MPWVGVLESVHSDEIVFKLRSGWRVRIYFDKMQVSAELLTEAGEFYEFVLNMSRADYVEGLLDILDSPERHKVKLAMVILLSYAPERKVREKNWLDAIMGIDFEKEGQPLKPKYKFYVREWWSTKELTFDTVEFFRSIYNRITRRELARVERDTIMLAMRSLQEKGCLWHPEVKKWASKIVARLMAEKLSS